MKFPGLALLLICGISTTYAECDTDWVKLMPEKCAILLVKEAATNKDEAKLKCEGLGAELISVGSESEQNNLVTLLFNETQGSSMWLGAIRDPDNLSEFVWEETEAPLTFTKWREGSPSPTPLNHECTQVTTILEGLFSPHSDMTDGDVDADGRSRVKADLEHGDWKDVSCKKNNLVACQKLQSMSAEEMQALLLELRDNLVALRSEFDALNLYQVDTLLPENSKKIQSCSDIQAPPNFEAALSRRFILRDNKFEIYPFGETGNASSVQCDFETDGGGWTIIQRRDSGESKDQFFLDWDKYEGGFDFPDGNYWLGLETIAQLTSAQPQELRIDLGDWEGNHAYAKYSTFSVEADPDSYPLKIDGYSGTAGDSMGKDNGRKFVTFDRNNEDNCANLTVRSGAWWYSADCSESNLNGLYYPNQTATFGDGVFWSSWKNSFRYSLKSVQIKIRNAGFGAAK